jgi:acyl carrier protein
MGSGIFHLFSKQKAMIIPASATKHTETTLKAWLVQRVASYARRPPETIAIDVPLADYGLDSVYALTLVGDIEDYLGLSLEPTLMWDHPDINSLSSALLGMTTPVSIRAPLQEEAQTV